MEPTLSRSYLFHLVIMVGWTPNSEASAAVVFSSLMAFRATLALNRGEYCLRLLLIWTPPCFLELNTFVQIWGPLHHFNLPDLQFQNCKQF